MPPTASTPAADAAPDAAPAVDRRTLFVTDISYDATATAVQSVFEEVGPVRSCFLVGGEGKAAKHKGCGYVKFALAEDAERALAKLQGTPIAGRPVRVELARKRAPLEERKRGRGKGGEDREKEDGGTAAASGAAAPAPTRAARKPGPVQKQTRTPAAKALAATKHVLVRTVALGNLTPDMVAPALALARAGGNGGGVTEVTNPAPADAVARAGLSRDGCAGGVAFITYGTVKQAMAAVARLHGATVGGGGGKEGDAGAADDAPPPSKKSKKKGGASPAPVTGLVPTTVLWARQVSGEGALLKKWRLIIRNLGFTVDEAALRALLSPAGFVWELNIPRRPDGSPRGFAFAGFTCRSHAAKAIALANAVVLGGRPIAVDWAVGKAAFAAAAGAAATAAGEEGAGAGAGAGAPTGDEQTGPPYADAGPAFGSDADADPGTVVDVIAEQRLLKDVIDQFTGGEGEGALAAPSAGAKAAAAAALAAKEEAAAAAKAARAAVAAADQATRTRAAAAELAASGAGVNATVFVRGLPADATVGVVRTRLEAFGDVRACRLVVDKKTGRPKGTAFVEYANEAGAAAAATAAERAASGDGPPVCVGGSPISLARALTQDGARALATARAGGPDAAALGLAMSASAAGKKSAVDGRNLYLAKEGAIEPGSPAWEALPPADRALRARAAAEVRTKLKSPNFSVSRTRLCLRNLPFAVDEATLKPLLVKAVTDRASKAVPKLVQVKVLRGAVAAKPGKAVGATKSRGMAFAEFEDHEHALCALRSLNNSPAPFGADRRPIVEFAVDDARALHKRARAAAAVAVRSAEAKAKADLPEEKAKAKAAAANKKSRSARRKERKLREAAGEDGGPGVAAGVEEGPPAKKQRRGHSGEAAAPPAAPASPPPRQARRTAKGGDDGAAAAATSALTTRRPLSKNKKRAGGGEETEDRLDKLVAAYKTKVSKAAAGLDKWL